MSRQPAVNQDIEHEIRLADPDGFYARLIDMHDGLDTDQSNLFNATIILLMANQIGDDEVLSRILAQARESSSLST
ncbi:MAG: hypothetical protein DHS20C01_21140 [marine bacterium B5-7]|nr:MAG: hypothetical protein DHS20C01_21140 [marine bacterium B5-7]